MPRRIKVAGDQSIRNMLVAYHEAHGKRMREAFPGPGPWPPSVESIKALNEPEGCYVDSGELFAAFLWSGDERWRQFTWKAVKERNNGRDFEWYDLDADGSLTWIGEAPQ